VELQEELLGFFFVDLNMKGTFKFLKTDPGGIGHLRPCPAEVLQRVSPGPQGARFTFTRCQPGAELQHRRQVPALHHVLLNVTDLKKNHKNPTQISSP